MSKKYGRQQLAQRTKPTENPPSGFIELFADSNNSGKLTVLNSDGAPDADSTKALGYATTTGVTGDTKPVYKLLTIRE